MPWSTPTLGELRRLIRDNVSAFLPGADATVPNSVLRVLTDSNAGLAALTLQYLDWLARQIMVDTAEAEWLDRFGQIWLGGRKAAVFSEGAAFFTGIPGTVIPTGARIATSNSAVEFETVAAGTLGDAPIQIPVRAIDPGAAGNLLEGAPLNVTSAVAGLDATVFAAIITGGVDAESDADLRGRILDRIRKPPMGGDADDYVAWALEVPGVTRAWTAPMEMGIGTVTLRFMMDELRATSGGFPNAGDVAAVAEYLEAKRPVTVRDLFVVAPIPEPIDFTLEQLDSDDAGTRFNIEAAVAVMLHDRARPAFALNGVRQPAQTIHREWVSAAISSAAGVETFNLVMTDHAMPSPGHMGVLGTIIRG
jgi:uncharacterized phage protein gp47/JayE